MPKLMMMNKQGSARALPRVTPEFMLALSLRKIQTQPVPVKLTDAQKLKAERFKQLLSKKGWPRKIESTHIPARPPQAQMLRVSRVTAQLARSMKRPERIGMPTRTWEDEELAGLGKSLKKIGKKIGKAFKGKNLLKTAAVAAVAYGGYKLATGKAGTGWISKIGSGLANAGKAAMKVAPQLASSFIAYKTATTPGMDPSYVQAQPGASFDYPESIPGAAGLQIQPPEYEPAEGDASSATRAGTMPGWVIPAAIGAGLLLLLSSRK